MRLWTPADEAWVAACGRQRPPVRLHPRRPRWVCDPKRLCARPVRASGRI